MNRKVLVFKEKAREICFKRNIDGFTHLVSSFFKLEYVLTIAEIDVIEVFSALDLLILIIHNGVKDIDYIFAHLAGQDISDVLSVLVFNVLLVVDHRCIDEFFCRLVPSIVAESILSVFALVVSGLLIEQEDS